MQIALWIFPPEDFADWCKLVGTPEVGSHAEYMAMIAAVQADQERQGREVVRVHFTVAQMVVDLAERGLPNTPDNRACVTALKSQE